MRKILLETLLKAPLTEPRAAPTTILNSPRLRAGARRSARGSAAACRSGRSTPARAMAANWKSTRSTIAFYDLERFGLKFVASPRHADVLLVTGPVTRNMREALERTYDATPDPKWVVAVGRLRPRMAAFSPAATPASAALASRSRSTCTFPAVRRRRYNS